MLRENLASGRNDGPLFRAVARAKPFVGPTQDVALDRLRFALRSRAALTVFTGYPGAGRSRLLAALVAEQADKLPVVLLDGASIPAGGLADSVLRAFGHGQGGDGEDLWRLLQEHARAGHIPVVVIDDADAMDRSALAEIADLIGPDPDERPLLKFILAGPPELYEALRKELPELVGPSVALDPMGEDDSAAFIRHAAGAAGLQPGKLSDEAIEEIVKCGGGIAARILSICEACLETVDDNSSVKDRSTVRRAIMARGIRATPVPRGGSGGESAQVGLLETSEPMSGPEEAQDDDGAGPAARMTRAMRALRRSGREKAAPVSDAKPADAPARFIRRKPEKDSRAPDGRADAPPRRRRVGLVMTVLVGLAVTGGILQRDRIGAVLTTVLGRSDRSQEPGATAPPPAEITALVDRISAALGDVPPDAETRFRLAVDLGLSDPQAAIVAYSLAALLGHERAAYYLGQIYEAGEGVASDASLARKWYRQSGLEPAAAMLQAASGSLSTASASGGDAPAPPQPLYSGIDATGAAEFVWAPGRGGDVDHFRLDVADKSGRIVTSIAPIELTAARVTLPQGAAHWRVAAFGPGAGALSAQSPWLPITVR